LLKQIGRYELKTYDNNTYNPLLQISYTEIQPYWLTLVLDGKVLRTFSQRIRAEPSDCAKTYFEYNHIWVGV